MSFTIAYEIIQHYGISSDEYLAANNFDQNNKHRDETINKLRNQLHNYGERMMPVSYTHLDVYKRQSLKLAMDIAKIFNVAVEELFEFVDSEN